MPAESDLLLILRKSHFLRSMRHLSILVLLLISLAISTSAHSSSSSFTGRTIDVADGDTITVLTQNNESVKVPLKWFRFCLATSWSLKHIKERSNACNRCPFCCKMRLERCQQYTREFSHMKFFKNCIKFRFG